MIKYIIKNYSKAAESNKNFAGEDFYQEDFVSLMKSGHIVKKEPSTHIEHIKFAEPIGCGLYVVTEANLVTDM